MWSSEKQNGRILVEWDARVGPPHSRRFVGRLAVYIRAISNGESSHETPVVSCGVQKTDFVHSRRVLSEYFDYGKEGKEVSSRAFLRSIGGF